MFCARLELCGTSSGRLIACEAKERGELRRVFCDAGCGVAGRSIVELRLRHRMNISNLTHRGPLVYVLLLSVGAMLCLGVEAKHEFDKQAALTAFLTESRKESRAVGVRIEHTMNQIYEGMRTIARLQGVRAIDRYAVNFDENARQAVQEIYNNLGSSVVLSEVYIVPLDMDPSEWDLTTGWMQAPITTCDELILSRNASRGVPKEVPGGTDSSCTRCHESVSRDRPPTHITPVEGLVEEIEFYEYELMAEQLEWLRRDWPREESLKGLNFPAVSGREVITCDNSRYDPQRPNDKDRSGLIYSVPFYGLGGDIKGCISGVILTSALRDLVPGGGMAIVNVGANYAAPSWDPGPSRDHPAEVSGAQPTTNLLYSEVLDLDVLDAVGNWELWAARPDSEHWRRADVKTASTLARLSYLTVVSLVLMACSFVRLGRRHRGQLERQNIALEARVQDRTAALAQRERQQAAVAELGQRALGERNLSGLFD